MHLVHHLWISLLLVVVTMIVTTVQPCLAWMANPPLMSRHHSASRAHHLFSLPEKVEVCGFKDCKSRGGGPRLQTLIQEIVDDRGWPIQVESCDCQGECGYGPNVVVDGRLVNGVKRNVESVLQALGVPEEKGAAEAAAAATATTTTSAANNQS